ncbi:hypothetical protein [Denitratisoma sp. DHT3]|uniref:hypothetical protein n=1 Tax=Denitratisoma sp. DHT3 TaxID=1981880 RepID=UPI00119D1031|nr:hypothetical protein [Denitratisoma sp. DHT3]
MPRLACLLLSLALSACSSVSLRGSGNQYWLKASAPAIVTAADSLFAYHAYVRGLSAAEWSKENEQVRETANRENSEFQRMRQAIAAAAPAAGAREHVRALQQFEQLERESAKQNSSLRGLIAALRSELAERRRLEDALREESRRAEDLEQKLDALKAIERNLQDRSPSAVPAVKKSR